ncbi:MAG: glycosyltransferase family 39 protein, partial [Desulforhabdus sp.]|nr:glycosyltransferase family 39 protein [Desulforhabdus sp.]
MFDWTFIKRLVIVLACFVLVQIFYLGYQQQPVWDPPVILPAYTFLLLSAALAATKRNRLRDLFVRNEALILLITASLLGYSFYREYVSLGGTSEPTVFRSWCDQFAYYKMLDLLKAGQFKSEVYFYGLGYPILGYAVSWLYPRDPYYVVNLVSFLAVYFLIYKMLDRFTDNKLLAYLAATLYALFPFPRTFIVEPWTSTVSLTCYSAAIVTCLKEKLGWLDWLLMGLLTGLIFAARYVDIVLLIPVWLCFFGRAFSTHNMKSIAAIAAGGCVTILIIFSVAYTHKMYLGGYFQTPYKH